MTAARRIYGTNRLWTTLIVAAVAALAGVVAAVEPGIAAVVVGGVAIAVGLLLVPPLLVAAAIHAGVWNTAPIIEQVGQEAPTLALIGITVLLLGSRMGSLPMPRSLVRAGIVAGVFVAYALISGLLMGGPGAMEKGLRLALFAGWAFLLASLIGVSRRATIASLLAVVAGSTLIAVAALVVGSNTDLPTLFGTNRIVLGRSIGIGAAIALGAAISVRLPVAWRLIALALGLALVAATIMAASRGAFVSIAVAGVVMTVLPLAGRGARSRVVGLAAVAGAACIAFVVASGSVGFGRLVLLAEPTEDMAGQLRAQAIGFALQQWETSPLFGVGLRDLDLTLTLGRYSETVAYPHNIIAETGSQTGVVGLVLLVAAIGLAAAAPLRHRALRADPVVTMLFGAFTFYVTAAQFSGDLQINRFIWTFAFLLAATPAWLTRETKAIMDARSGEVSPAPRILPSWHSSRSALVAGPVPDEPPDRDHGLQHDGIASRTSGK